MAPQAADNVMNRLSKRLSGFLNLEGERKPDHKKVLTGIANRYGFSYALYNESSLNVAQIKTLSLAPFAFERDLRSGNKEENATRSWMSTLYKKPRPAEHIEAAELVPGGRWLITVTGKNDDSALITSNHSLQVWDLLKVESDVQPAYAEQLEFDGTNHKIAIQADGEKAVSVYVTTQIPGDSASLVVWSFSPSNSPTDGARLEQTFSASIPATWVHSIQVCGRFIIMHCDDQFKILIWDRETNHWNFVHLASLWHLKLGDVGRKKWSCIVGLDEKTLTVWAGANLRTVHFSLPPWIPELAQADRTPVVVEHAVDRRKGQGAMHWVRRARESLESLTPTLLLPQDVVNFNASTTYEANVSCQLPLGDTLHAEYCFLSAASSVHGDTLVLQVDAPPDGTQRWQLSLLHATEKATTSIPHFTTKIILQGGEQEQWGWVHDYYTISPEAGFILHVSRIGEINVWRPQDMKDEVRSF